MESKDNDIDRDNESLDVKIDLSKIDFDLDVDIEGAARSFLQGIKDSIEAAKDLLVHYGPPYIHDKEKEEDFLYEISKKDPSLTKIHTFLNDKIDPNIKDPLDYHFAGIHYCARNSAYLILAMLIRAGADINSTNELGMTALSICVCFVPTPDNRENQFKIINILIKNKADYDVRDKAGYTALDYAVMNNDIKLVLYFLELGSKVLRINDVLVAQRESILKHAADTNIYRYLKEKLFIEEEAYHQRQKVVLMIERQKKEAIAKVKDHKKMQQHREKLHRLNEIKEKEKAEQMNKQVYEGYNKARLQRDADRKKQEDAHAEYNANRKGVWIRSTDSCGSQWTFDSNKSGTGDTVMVSGLQMMNRLCNANSLDTFNQRWKAANSSTDCKIEFKWVKDSMYKSDKNQDDCDGDTSNESIDVSGILSDDDNEAKYEYDIKESELDDAIDAMLDL